MTPMRLLFLLWFGGLGAALGIAEPVVFVDPLVTGASPETAALVQREFSRALDQWSDDSTAPTIARASSVLSAVPAVTTNVSFGEGSLTAVQVFSAPGASSRTRVFTVPWPTNDLPLLFRRVDQALLRTPSEGGLAPGPQLVDSLSLSSILGTDLPVDPSVLFPAGLALRSDGHLFVAAYATVLEFDDSWRVVNLPAKPLTDEGVGTLASGVFVSPGGTLFVRAQAGGEVDSFAPGSSRYRRWTVKTSSTDTLGVFPDGSLFVASTSKKVVVYREKDPDTLDLSGLVPYASAVAAGPENTLWVVDAASGAIKIVLPNGQLQDVLFPDLAPGTGVRKLLVEPNGSFLVLSTGDLRAFDRGGRLRWVYDGTKDAAGVNFALLTDFAADPGSPFLFAVDAGTRRILRFADPGRLTASEKTLAALTQQLRRHPNQTDLEKAIAQAYADEGAFDQAVASLDGYLGDNPEDAEAQDLGIHWRVTLGKHRVEEEVAEVRKRLQRWGPETARDAYVRGMKTLEGLQAVVPDDPEVRAQKTALKTLFAQAEAQDRATGAVPQVVSVELGGLFPSLMQVYLSKSPGTMTVKNTLAEPLQGLRVDFFLPPYMDSPAQGTEVPPLAPGGSAVLSVPVALNPKALELEEDSLLEAQMTVRYSTSQGPQAFSVTRPVTLYRRTAITWDVTAKLAAFITPNEQTVDVLAHRLVKDSPDDGPLSPGFLRAVTLVSGLGAIPLRYVPNPHTPISQVLGNHRVVDTVRFPRTTLLYESGDCSDTTALTASILEAAGIPTAIVTTPGHVFLAFDPGEAEDQKWLFQGPGYETLEAGGELWIPIETTVLAQGFMEAWRTASGLVKTYRETKDFEFIPLQGVRALYPPLALPPATLSIRTPDRGQTLALVDRALATLNTDVYRALLSNLERGRTGLAGRALSRQNNRIGILMGRFGPFNDANAVFESIVQTDPTFVPAYINGANLALEHGNRARATELASRAQAVAPDSAAVAYLIRQIGVSGRPEKDTAQGRATGEMRLNWPVE